MHDNEADLIATGSLSTDGSEREEWDDRYSQQAPLGIGGPDDVLVTEVSQLPTGAGLEVCCGEGSNAIWLARRGWTVTAIDVSTVALSRAAQAADAAGVQVSWIQADLTRDRPISTEFDLVTAMYPALLRTTDDAALRFVLGAVAPGGTLVFVHHEPHDTHRAHGFEPNDYVSPALVASRLDDNWVIEVNEHRVRTSAPGHGGDVVPDIVVRARRR